MQPMCDVCVHPKRWPEKIGFSACCRNPAAPPPHSRFVITLAVITASRFSCADEGRRSTGDWLLLQTDKGCPEVADDALFKTVAEVQSVHDCQWKATHVDRECASYGGAMLLKSIDSPHGCRCMRRAPDNVTLVPCHLDPTMRGWDIFLFIGVCEVLTVLQAQPSHTARMGPTPPWMQACHCRLHTQHSLGNSRMYICQLRLKRRGLRRSVEVT
jgi:hypothetical protein